MDPFRYLSKDPVMKRLIETHGPVKIVVDQEDLISRLVQEIVSQQLSIKAADTRYGRFKNLLSQSNPFLPEEILTLSDDDIRTKAGISYAKIRYIKGIAQATVENHIDFNDLINQSDAEVFDSLITLKGIGPWTAEMILMNSLGRPDIFSIGDAGLRRAISALYPIAPSDLSAMMTLSETWTPYRSYASRYLWKSLDTV